MGIKAYCFLHSLSLLKVQANSHRNRLMFISKVDNREMGSIPVPTCHRLPANPCSPLRVSALFFRHVCSRNTNVLHAKVQNCSKNKMRGAWMAQSLKSPTLDFGSSRDRTGLAIKPHVGLHIECGACLRFFLLRPLPLPTLCECPLSLNRYPNK